MIAFEESYIGNCKLANRIVRSATYEGACSADGIPGDDYYKMYSELSAGGPGLIITGFVHIAPDGKAMQKSQAGFDTYTKAMLYKKITDEVHCNGSKIFIQLAHTGRQTINERVQKVRGVSTKASPYFKSKPEPLSTFEVKEIIQQFAQSAKWAKDAGFDGVQVHAAHGYLVHQFLLPALNNRKDIFGIDKTTGLGTLFLQQLIENIKNVCGNDYPVILKISGSADGKLSFSEQEFVRLILFLNNLKIDAIEVSYGTMDVALNIIRGDIPLDLILKVNPFYKGHSSIYNTFWKALAAPVIKRQIKPYSSKYNLKYALIARQHTEIPIISVGGYRNIKDINFALNNGIEYISLCRPFICEPDIVKKFREKSDYNSKCINCNFCTIMCDSGKPTKCYKFKTN